MVYIIFSDIIINFFKTEIVITEEKFIIQLG